MSTEVGDMGLPGARVPNICELPDVGVRNGIEVFYKTSALS